MKPREWMIGAALAALTAAAVWGSFRTSVEAHEKRLTVIEEWRPTIDSKLGGIDAKIDLLLRANDIEPPRHR